ncbi:sirohydrochlorin chelatase [Rhodococcus sp. NPDC058521]|uniref:sirohydrochlorin chelatase n=1 Tax=Rhodococcus sp. NPDC058521 TaxID=3346536 RepID=UPI00365B7F32
MTPLVAVAHGSRDPRSARMVAAAVAAIRDRRPDLDVRLCFLDLNAPSVEQVLDAIAVEGHESAVVVPLLLGSAFHARVDLPAILDRVRVRHPELTVVQSDVLGGDVRLLGAVRDRVVQSGFSTSDSTLGVAFAAVGSSDEHANALTRSLGESFAVETDWMVETCFATAAEPGVGGAIERLRATGAERVVVAPWFLAPGLLTDRLGHAAEVVAPDTVFAAPIGPHHALVDLVLERFAGSAPLVAPNITLSA